MYSKMPTEFFFQALDGQLFSICILFVKSKAYKNLNLYPHPSKNNNKKETIKQTKKLRPPPKKQKQKQQQKNKQT